MALSSFLISRNNNANGALGIIIGIWLFSCQAHIDIKHIFCHIGLSISDMAVQNALMTMTQASCKEMQEQVSTAAKNGEVAACLILDNIQVCHNIYEPGIGRQNELLVGCAGTAVYLKNCKKDAWSLPAYQSRLEELQ